MFGALNAATARILLAAIVLALSASSAFSQTTEATPAKPAKVDELIQLLRDPDVQKWLENAKPASAAVSNQQPAKPEPATSQTTAPRGGLASWEVETRERIHDVVAAVPDIPLAVADAARRVRQDAISRGYAPVFLIFVVLIALGFAAELLLRRLRPAAKGPLDQLLPVCAFAVVIGIVFFAIEWPPLGRLVLIAYLGAFIAYRFGSTLIGIGIAERKRLAARLRLLLALALAAVATRTLGTPLGVDPSVSAAIAYSFSVILLAISVETVWVNWPLAMSWRLAVTAYLFGVWLLWCLDLKGLFWLGLYAIILPVLLRSATNIAASLSPYAPGSLGDILAARGARAVVIILAAGWLAVVWHLNPQAPAHDNPVASAIFYGLLKSVVVLLVADLLWQVAKNWIDRNIAESASDPQLSAPDAARRARFRTLLPIFRNALAVMVAVMAALVVLAELGVQIGPLLAGAGIFGVALGFGSQTLVKDVIGGIFYLMDDAFRVGEYIQAKSYKGTVEGFSLRSIRLRHHRGPVYTVPFGELGAVENMSRDWVIDKFRITVGFDTDVEKARKIAKAIGADMQADPELGPLFIEPLKMKGVEEFTETGIVLSFAMTTVPGMQSSIRRKAYVKIREAFRKEGIEFAQPTVQVEGEQKSGSVAAATATVRRRRARATALKEQEDGAAGG
jgi:small-conductance mechanosensitive channel